MVASEKAKNASCLFQKGANMDTITVVLVNDEMASWHPTKVGKYFKVIEFKSNAYVIEDCLGNRHDVFSSDFRTFIWNNNDWNKYCGSIV